MSGSIIDRNRWIKERLQFLNERLAAGPPDDERRAIEAEIETLAQERRLGRLKNLFRRPRP
jgi:hypothetical protein